MDVSAENEPAAPPWETFVLASCADLARFPQVHLAPRFPPGRSNLALKVPLPLADDELLVALIEDESAGARTEIVLTTARLYWSEPEPAPQGGRGRRAAVSIRTYGMDYALIAPDACTVSTTAEGTRIELAAGRSLAMHGAGRDLPEALAAYLRRVRDAAVRREPPRLNGFDPALLQRIERAFPRIVEVTQRTRTLCNDLLTFRRDLLAATAHVVVTPVLVASCVAVYLLMLLRGVDPLLPSAGQLLAWGANDGSRVVLRHEVWRLPASVFIHGGLIHLAVNMWCLLNIGPLIERLFGNAATALIYLAAGAGGAIASMATLPPRVSVGASGAIFGLLGALLAFLLINRRSVPATVFRPLRSSALGFVAFNTLFAAMVPNIDQSAHLGGLATGFLGGLALVRPWPVVHSAGMRLRRVLLGSLLAACVIAAGVGVIRWRERTLPPRVRLADFKDQAATAISEFDAISRSLPEVHRLLEGAGDDSTRQKLGAALREIEPRASSNLDRLRRITTPDPGLQQLRQALIDSQAAQVALIAGTRAYLETGNSDVLNGPSGILASARATIRAQNEVRELLQDYLKANGLESSANVPQDED